MFRRFIDLLAVAVVCVPGFYGAILLQEAVSRSQYIEALTYLGIGVAMMLLAYCAFPDDEQHRPKFRIGRWVKRKPATSGEEHGHTDI